MYKLTVVFGGKTIEKKAVDSDRVVIGRSHDCDLVIDNLGVSRQHAEIVREGKDAHVIRDLKSNNGTYVNGKRIARYNLNDGDEVAIGKFTITFNHEPEPAEEAAAEAAAADEAQEPEKPRGGEFTLAIDSRLMDQRQRERASKLKAYLLIGKDGEKRKSVLLEKSIFSIGKAKTCDFQVGGFFTARKHALIVRDETGFRLVDTSQKRRTYLNESSVDEERLKDGDYIRVGKLILQFMVGTPQV